MLTEIYNSKSVKSKFLGTTTVTDTFIIYTLLGLKFTIFLTLPVETFANYPQRKFSQV